MNSKIKSILISAVTVLAAGMVLFSGAMKLTQGTAIVDTLRKMGVDQYILLLGIMEIGFTVLFLFPKTMKLGFILLSCYFAGAIATELSHGSSLNAVTPLILVWASAFLRDRTIFLPTPLNA